jgi:hypothetical protein
MNYPPVSPSDFAFVVNLMPALVLSAENFMSLKIATGQQQSPAGLSEQKEDYRDGFIITASN